MAEQEHPHAIPADTPGEEKPHEPATNDLVLPDKKAQEVTAGFCASGQHFPEVKP
jgi:hypothetical protein